jgi:hypothetical protein
MDPKKTSISVDPSLYNVFQQACIRRFNTARANGRGVQEAISIWIRLPDSFIERAKELSAEEIAKFITPPALEATPPEAAKSQ